MTLINPFINKTFVGYCWDLDWLMLILVVVGRKCLRFPVRKVR